MATVTITIEDDIDEVLINLVADPMPELGEDQTPAHTVAAMMMEYIDRLKEAAEDEPAEAA